MTSASKKRRFASWFVFTFLGLAMAVFAWGLAYKLSLYDPPQAVSRQMPQAKLLSREQQPSVEMKASVQPDPPDSLKTLGPDANLALLLACVSLLAGSAFLIRLQSSELRFRPRLVLALSHIFFRPPPFRA
ncbi:hypothetical protein [Silvibacterium acidisoli]|uniref:hypothetical protein n=1 Tax=Acidobacteriaceae bacterium ZG23-2 TaxID=2883246 RepID=UPI00406CBBF6